MTSTGRAVSITSSQENMLSVLEGEVRENFLAEIDVRNNRRTEVRLNPNMIVDTASSIMFQQYDDHIRSPQFPYDIGFDEMPKSTRKLLSASESKKLEDETRRVINALADRANIVASHEQNLGRRERQYLEIVKREKQNTVSAAEIILSEFPLRVAGLKRGIKDEILKSGSCNGMYIDKKEESIFQCMSCDRHIPYQYAFICNGSLWCAEHVPYIDECAGCQSLRSGCSPIDTFDGHSIMVCENCIASPMICTSCGGLTLTPDLFEIRMCMDCINRTDTGEAYRPFSLVLAWTSNPAGEVVKSPRIFSSEIECILPSSTDIYRLSAGIPKECGISGDGSIHTDEGAGVEIQTPKLKGAKGEELVHLITDQLKEIGASVNKSCGLHIHLDGKGIVEASRREYPVALLQLWKAHLIFEDSIMSFLPYERRVNDFCRPMRDSFSVSQINGCESLLDIEKLWYKERTYSSIKSSKNHHYHSSRYFGVNFHSLLGHGHLEIRYHSATTNPRKILEWANLHALIMDAASKKSFTEDFLRDAQATSALNDKTEMLFDRIKLAESSRQYFRARQKKFRGKNEIESVTN